MIDHIFFVMIIIVIMITNYDDDDENSKLRKLHTCIFQSDFDKGCQRKA